MPMSGANKLAALAVVLIFGLALFVLGVDMVVNSSTYEKLVPSFLVEYLGQALMFLAFFFTFATIAFLSGFVQMGSPRTPGVRIPPDDALSRPTLQGEAAGDSSGLPPMPHTKIEPPVPEEDLPHLIGLTGGLPNRLLLRKGTFTIGRDPDCDLVLSSQLVSRRHAQLEWTGEELLIHDLGSSNQTRVNDKALEKEISLQDGDVIQIVDYHLEVELPISQSRTVILAREPKPDENPTVHLAPGEE